MGYSYLESTRTVLSVEAKYQERDTLFRPNTERGDRPFRSHTRAVLSLKSEIPGHGYSSRPNTMAGKSPDQLPGRRYPLEGIPGRGNPARLNTRAAPPLSDQLSGRCFPSGANYLVGPPLRIKYKRKDFFFRPNTRTALSHSDQIPVRGRPLQARYQGGVLF